MKTYTAKQLRLERGLTQEDLAKNLGVSRGSIWIWESGTGKIGDLNRYKVARFFGVEPEQIVDAGLEE